jgi:hypothetical protein
MLPGGMDPLYRSVLAAGHRRYVRLEVWSGDGLPLESFIPAQFTGDPEGGLAFFSGSVSATLTSRVARNLSFNVPQSMYPTQETDLLSPFGNEIRAFMGVTLGDGSHAYSWQVFRGKIQEVSMDSSSGTCTVVCADRAAEVVDHGFVSPQNSQVGNSINAEWQRLIVDALADATFGTSDTFNRSVASMTWEFDRGSALDEMTRSVGALWYPLANGDFVLRKLAWTVANPLVFSLTDATGGTVNSFLARRSRESIFNVVTVTGERLNGDAPVFATAENTTATSPTRVGGPFGTKSRLDRLQTPNTQGGANHAAQVLLRAYIAPVEEWTLQAVPDAALELGDAGTLILDGREAIQVVTSFTLPLDLTGNMTISTRSVVVGGD